MKEFIQPEEAKQGVVVGGAGFVVGDDACLRSVFLGAGVWFYPDWLGGIFDCSWHQCVRIADCRSGKMGAKKLQKAEK